MIPYPRGLSFIKNEMWDSTTMLTCDGCGEPTEQYRGFYLSKLDDKVKCENENCDNEFTVEQGLNSTFMINDPRMVHYHFTEAMTMGKSELKIGEFEFISNQELGLNHIKYASATTDGANIKGIVQIFPEGIVVGCVYDGEIKEKKREISINYAIFGTPLQEIDFESLWIKILSQSRRLIEQEEYPISIILAHTAFEVFLNSIVKGFVILHKDDLSQDEYSRLTNPLTNFKKYISKVTDSKIDKDNPHLNDFEKYVSKRRNKIVHEGNYKLATKKNSKISTVKTLFLIKQIADYLDRDVLYFSKLLEWRENRDYEFDLLLDYTDYIDILLEELMEWLPGINADCLAHQKFIHTDEGKKFLYSKIGKGKFGECKTCGAKLVPLGRRNKPMRENLHGFCLICNKAINKLHIDGAYYGSWMDEETINTLSKIVQK